MLYNRLYKCDVNQRPIPNTSAVVEKSITEDSIYFSGKDIPMLKLGIGDYVYFEIGENENPDKLFVVEFFITHDMIKCTPPINEE